jgi:hypothetical protein
MCGKWVKGHHYPHPRETKYVINQLADAYATEFYILCRPPFHPEDCFYHTLDTECGLITTLPQYPTTYWTARDFYV